MREKRNRQIMTPVHWEHSWNYFCRKLEARTARPVRRRRPSSADGGSRAMSSGAGAEAAAAISASRCGAARMCASCRARDVTSTTSLLPGVALVRLRAQPARPCAHPHDLDRGGRGAAGRAADADRAGLGKRRPRRAHGRASDAVQRRPADERGAAPGLRARQGPSRRRHRRRRRRREPVARRKTAPRRSRSTTSRCPP